MEKTIKNAVILFILLILFTINVFGATKECKYEVSDDDSINEFRTKDYARNFMTLVIYQNYEKAYDMLTDECKEELADNDIQKFIALMQDKVYYYGKIPKGFSYQDTVECEQEQGVNVYSQMVEITHDSLGKMEIDFDDLSYDVYEYIAVTGINFIIYETNPYNYKVSLQLIEI